MGFDPKKVIEWGMSLPLMSNERGIMAAFGIYAAMNFNEFFFSTVSKIMHMAKEEDALEIENKLYQAVLDCAYYTFHGARTSVDWQDYIAPMIKTKEDELLALVAFTNIFGVGYINVVDLIPGEKLVTEVKNAYDPPRYIEEFGIQKRARCYMFAACTAACMDLVYGPKFPNGIGTFKAKEVLCIAKGDPICRFIATPKNT